MTVVSRVAADEAARIERRTDRLNARYVQWSLSGLDRTRACGRFLTDVDGGKREAASRVATVRVSGSVADGSRSAGIGGVQTCGSVWACPVCAQKIQAERQAQVSAALAVARLRGWEVLFLTLTMRHERGHRLARLWDHLSSAWRSVTSGSPGVPYIGKRGKMCAGSKGDAWKADKVEFGIEGYLRLVEVTHGGNGWHVHVHALLFVNPWQADPGHTWRDDAGQPMLTDAAVDVLGARLFGRWRKALDVGKGIRPSARHGVDIKRVRGDELIAEYFAKNVYTRKGESSTAHDVTGAHAKTAKNGNRTPFGILRSLVAMETGEVSADYDEDLALWNTYEKASSGRQQLVWSNGLRAELGIDVEERTDQEIAEEEHGGDEVARLTQLEWRWIAGRRMIAFLLYLAESDDTGQTVRDFIRDTCRESPPD